MKLGLLPEPGQEGEVVESSPEPDQETIQRYSDPGWAHSLSVALTGLRKRFSQEAAYIHEVLRARVTWVAANEAREKYLEMGRIVIDAETAASHARREWALNYYENRPLADRMYATYLQMNRALAPANEAMNEMHTGALDLQLDRIQRGIEIYSKLNVFNWLGSLVVAAGKELGLDRGRGKFLLGVGAALGVAVLLGFRPFRRRSRSVERGGFAL